MSKPIISKREVAARVADLQRQATKALPGRERDLLEAEIETLRKLYPEFLTGKPGMQE